jgi:hypothetical protein
MEAWIRELCRLIGAENDGDRLQKLARELDFAITEFNLQLQNKTFSVGMSLGYSSQRPLKTSVRCH